MPRKGGGIAWASPFRSRKKKSEPEPVQSNWATGPPKHLREKTSSFSGISHSQSSRGKQHADDDALQWATVVRDSNLRDMNVSSGRPTSLRGVSGEMRKKLDQQQHRHRVLKGDPRYFDDEEESKSSSRMMRSSSGHSKKGMRTGTAHTASIFRGSHGVAGGGAMMRGEEEEEEEHMQRSEVHANAFAPDTDSDKDMESEFGFSIGLSIEDGEPGRYGDDQDDDIDSVYAEAAAAAAAASGAVTSTPLMRHEEDGLMRSEVDSSVMGTESIVRSDGDIDSLVGQHLLVGHDVDFDDEEMYGAGGSVVAEDDSTRERRHHGVDGCSQEDDASLVDGSLVEAPQEQGRQRQQQQHHDHQQLQQQQQRISGDGRDGGQKPVSYGGGGIENEADGNNAVVGKSQLKDKNGYNSVGKDTNVGYDGYAVGESDSINDTNLRRHHLEHRRKKNDDGDVRRGDTHRELRQQQDQEVQEHRYPVRGDEEPPLRWSVSSVSAAVAAIDRGPPSKPRALSASRAASSTTPTLAASASTTATTAGEGAPASSRASTKAGSAYVGERGRRSSSVDTKMDDADAAVNSGGNPSAQGGAQVRRDAGSGDGGGKPVDVCGPNGNFDAGVTARGRERIGSGGGDGDGVNRERRAESMRLGRGQDGGFGSAAEILWERIRVLEQRLGSENGTESEERAAKLEKENSALNEKLTSLQKELQQQANAADVEKENAVLTKRLVALQSEAVEARAKEIARTRALEDRVKDMQKKLEEKGSKELEEENASLKEKLSMQKKLDENQSRELEKENASFKERMNDMQKKLDEERSKELDSENASLRERLSTLQTEVEAKNSETHQKEAENASLSKRLAELEQGQQDRAQSEEVEKENASLKERLAILEHEKLEARDVLEKENASLTQRVTTLTKQLEKAGGAPKIEEENEALNARVMVLQNELDNKMKASADEVAMLNRRISDLRKSHTENMAAAAEEFASLNERVNGRDRESRKLAAAHAAKLQAKDEEIMELQQSLAAATVAGAEEDSDGKLSSDAYEKRLREKDDEISRLETRLLLLHHKSINNIKDDSDIMGTGEALNDPMRKDSASSNSSSSSSRKDDGGVTDVEGGSTWSASTSVFSLSSGMSPPSSSFSPMDPPPSSSVGSGQHDGDAPVGSDAARFYDGDSGDREATGGSSRRGGVKITTTKRRYRKGDKDENAGKDPEDAHRGCLVVTCKSTSSTSTTSSRRRGSSSSGANSKEKEASSSSDSAAAVAARLAEAQGVEINPSYNSYGNSIGKGGNPALGFGGAQVQQTAAFWDVLSRTLSTSAGPGTSSYSSSGASGKSPMEREGSSEAAEENAGGKVPVREMCTGNLGKNVSFHESSTDKARGSASMRWKSSVSSCVESDPSATVTKKNRVGLEVFAGTSTLLCGWGERGRGDSYEDGDNNEVSGRSSSSDVSALKANKPCCCNASALTAAVEAKMREAERVAREREEMAQRAIEAAIRAEENARGAEEEALNALDAAEEKMAQAERITTSALWQAESDFSAAEESMREREERVRKAEEAARVMEGKAREERELCMELMASAKANTVRTEKELAAVRLETAQATATARAARLQSQPQSKHSMNPQVQSNQQQKQEQKQQLPLSSSPALVPPSPTHATMGSHEEGVVEGGDDTISIPATKATAAAVAMYVASMNAAADSSVSDN